MGYMIKMGYMGQMGPNLFQFYRRERRSFENEVG